MTKLKWHRLPRKDRVSDEAVYAEGPAPRERPKPLPEVVPAKPPVDPMDVLRARFGDLLSERRK